MLIRLTTESQLPLHEQIATAVRRAIGEGQAGVGDRLPAARELARALDVNMHTVLRAYGTLRDEGVIELRRGRGAVVVGEISRIALRTELRSVLREARRIGLSKAEVIEEVNGMLG
jgi:DNA-binding transcriptional regulator YhcF (GntR family)